MRGGELDRKITIQRLSITSSSSGEPIQTWTNVAGVRWSAAMKPVLASEGFIAPVEAAFERVEFRIRYSSAVLDLSPLDRILYPGLTDAQAADSLYVIPVRSIYDIIGVLEIGRREGLRIITNQRPDLQ